MLVDGCRHRHDVDVAAVQIVERGGKHELPGCRDFVGTLTKIDWQNPHPYFFVDVKDASGKVESWSFQAYSPVTLRRNGTDRQVFLDNVGKEVRVRGCLARNGKPNAGGRRHTAVHRRRAAPGRPDTGLAMPARFCVRRIARALSVAVLCAVVVLPARAQQPPPYTVGVMLQIDRMVQNFDVDLMCARTLALYEDLVMARRRAAPLAR